MDAHTIYSIIKPHLEMMEPQEKKSLSDLIAGIEDKKRKFKGKRKFISLPQAKKRITEYRQKEIGWQDPS